MTQSNIPPVSTFLNNFFSEGFARPNRYAIRMRLPRGINSADSGNWLNPESIEGEISRQNTILNRDGKMEISCHTCTMPGRTLMVYPHTQHSTPFNVPFSQQYDPVTFSFYADSKLSQRKFFDIWQTAVVNINDNTVNFFSEYTSDVEMWQLDRTGIATYGVTLYSAWPLSIAEVSYGFEQRDSVVNVNVTLAFKLWKANHDDTRIVQDV